MIFVPGHNDLKHSNSLADNDFQCTLVKPDGSEFAYMGIKTGSIGLLQIFGFTKFLTFLIVSLGMWLLHIYHITISHLSLHI